ncbi:MAG: ATPase, T2SS/T4P/T4SS family [Rickettsiales bacterium]|nr:ATPase, T2SS/T4P/T4SS family [Rickettsiales bacterium]
MSNQFGNFNLPENLQPGQEKEASAASDKVAPKTPPTNPDQPTQPPAPSPPEIEIDPLAGEFAAPIAAAPPAPHPTSETAPQPSDPRRPLTPPEIEFDPLAGKFSAPIAAAPPPSPTPDPSAAEAPLVAMPQVEPSPDTEAPPFVAPTAENTAPSSVSAADFSPAPAAAASLLVSDGEAPTKRPMRIGEKLMSLGLISDDQLQVALQEQKTSKKLLGAILVGLGFISEHALGEILAEASGAKKFDPKQSMLDPALVTRVPKEVALRHKVIAVSLTEDTLQLATTDVYNVLAVDQVRRFFENVQIEPIYCSEAEILELIDQYYDYELSIDGILREIETGERDLDDLSGTEEGYVNPTVRLVDAMLVDSIKVGASDIHFEPEGQFLRLRYRIDGDLVQVRSFHRNYWPAIAVRIKIMSGMNIAETRMPQDGRISFQVMGREVDFRVATQPTVHGENIVMRLLDKTKSLVPLEDLGFADHNINLLKKLLKRPEGIIIVTGPTGSGKTTTLYSILSYINSMDVNIMTLEDPVEYQLPLIRQTNVREGTIDFGNGIKSLMRQDPDIIFIGEVRDEDTALMAVRAALTGHQVFTTLHTNDALGAVPRLGDIGVPAHLLAGSLICTMAQRLARKLCQTCKKPRLATPEEAQILGFAPDSPPTVYDAVGCKQCRNTGHKGRTAIIEVLRVDEGLNELIATHATRNAMMNYALNNGFVTMVEDGIDKVLQGDIDIEQLISTLDMTDRM